MRAPIISQPPLPTTFEVVLQTARLRFHSRRAPTQLCQSRGTGRPVVAFRFSPALRVSVTTHPRAIEKELLRPNTPGRYSPGPPRLPFRRFSLSPISVLRNCSHWPLEYRKTVDGEQRPCLPLPDFALSHECRNSSRGKRYNRLSWTFSISFRLASSSCISSRALSALSFRRFCNDSLTRPERASFVSSDTSLIGARMCRRR